MKLAGYRIRWFLESLDKPRIIPKKVPKMITRQAKAMVNFTPDRR
jgi:hypothetical protein